MSAPPTAAPSADRDRAAATAFKLEMASAEPAAAAEPASVAPQPAVAAATAHMLDGDEIVEMTLKPSLWYVAVASLKFVLSMALAAAVWATAAGLLGIAAVTGFVLARRVDAEAGRVPLRHAPEPARD